MYSYAARISSTTYQILRGTILNYNSFRTFIEDIYKSSKQTPDGVHFIPPNYLDLFSLYSKVIATRSLAVLEFGSGWSTLVLALALQENKNRDLAQSSLIRHPNLYELMTVDCESDFMSLAVKRIPNQITIRIHQVETKAYMSLVNEQICTLYQHLPAFTADFIYLDGPGCGPNQILGDINGFSIRYGDNINQYGLPMSADLIRLEPHLWPGTMIVVDGRGANARFLKNNFKRNWKYNFDESLDQHIFRLDEPPWGRFSKMHVELKEKSS
jgi:hypothetical protein